MSDEITAMDGSKVDILVRHNFDLPPAGSPLQKLGARLADILDDDQFNNCESLLIAGWGEAKVAVMEFLSAASAINQSPHDLGVIEKYNRKRAKVLSVFADA